MYFECFYKSLHTFSLLHDLFSMMMISLISLLMNTNDDDDGDEHW